MKVLIACEESQTLTALFRSKGVECFSCDLKPAKINPDWHLHGNIFDFAGGGVRLNDSASPMHLFDRDCKQVVNGSTSTKNRNIGWKRKTKGTAGCN